MFWPRLVTHAAAAKAASVAATDYFKNGNEADVPAFAAAETNVHSAVDHVRQLTLDNPTQQRLVSDLNSETNQAFAALRQYIDLHRKGMTSADAIQGVIKDVRTVSADLNKTYDAMTHEENNLLKARSDAQAVAARRAKTLELWGGIFALLLMGSALAIFWRESSGPLCARGIPARSLQCSARTACAGSHHGSRTRQ